MIYDSIKNSKRYYNIHPNLDKVLDWLQKNDYYSLPKGITKIDGDEVYALHVDTKSYDETTQQYEIHHKYADFQIIVQKDERFFYDKPQNLDQYNQEYDEKGDAELLKVSKKPLAIIQPEVNDFIIFFPYEPHVPKIMDSIKDLVKIVFKFKI